MNFGSLFAGVGGFDLGFERAGWTCSWQVEWDKNCQSVLSYRWPNVVKYSDVQHVEGFNIEPVDVITFGSPCQDLSVAGKRAGLEGSRSSMFYEATRIIREMRYATNGQYPRMAIWENVPGALTSNKGNDFAAVIDEMADIGALAIEWHVLDAQWFGVPQRRKRVFLITCFDPSIARRSNGEILPVGQSCIGDSPKGRKKWRTIARDSESSLNENSIIGPLSASDYRGPNSQYVNDGKLVIENSSFVKSRRAQNKDDHETWKEDGPSPTLNAFDNTGETRATVLIAETVQPYILDGTRVNDVRVYRDGISPTLIQRMGTGGNNVPMVGQDSEKEMRVRRLTPVECERLMGFPDDHTKYGENGKIISDTNRYKMVGNAVAAPVAYWIANNLKKIITYCDTIDRMGRQWQI